jgi:hypothetical protein
MEHGVRVKEVREREGNLEFSSAMCNSFDVFFFCAGIGRCPRTSRRKAVIHCTPCAAGRITTTIEMQVCVQFMKLQSRIY